MEQLTSTEISKLAKKQLEKVPFHIADKFFAWIISVEKKGLEYVKKLPGYHDEPLKGKRKGQRSIRLSRSYRAIYEVIQGELVIVKVLEVNKHEY